MKNLSVIALLGLLTACAAPLGPGAYGDQARSQPRDPSQWRVVSVTPVPPGTAAQVAAKSADGKPVEYSSAPVALYRPAPAYGPAPGYVPAPAYGGAPLYGPAPIYAPAPAYYWPPVTLSLGFVFGRHWSRGHFGGRHRHR